MNHRINEDVQRCRDAILNAASENSELLNQLSKTEEAPSLFQAQSTTVDRIRNDLSEQEKALSEIKNSTEEQFYAHKKLRDSRIRRAFYRATKMLEKFEARAMKEEREYFNALAAQSKAERREKSLRYDLSEADKVLARLEQSSKAHGEIHKSIDALYDRLFTGPTPGFPHEDDTERAFYAARDQNDSTKRSIINARKALKLLNQAATNLTRADGYTRFALQDAKNSVFFFDEALDLVKFSDQDIDYALSAVDRACEHLHPLSPEMQAVKMGIVRVLGAARSKANISYDRTSIASSIDATRKKLEEGQNKLRVFIDQTKAKEACHLQEIRTTARALEDSRQALEEVRQSIFEEVAGFGEAAPPYNVCCDRADWFCEVPPPETHDGDILDRPEGPAPEQIAQQTAQMRDQNGGNGQDGDILDRP